MYTCYTRSTNVPKQFQFLPLLRLRQSFLCILFPGVNDTLKHLQVNYLPHHINLNPEKYIIVELSRKPKEEFQ
jgi:hypothetical protein